MAERSILYIEDNPENRLLVKRTLEASGYSVKEAVDGPSGLKAATESYPDVILLDISLPAMDGYDLARRFSEYAHLDDVPVLAVTANVMKGDKERALGAGCDGYIPKPINIDQLPREIEEALERFGRGDGGPEPSQAMTPPVPADREETKSDAEEGSSKPGSKEFDLSSLFPADVDDGGAQSTESEESGLGTPEAERVSPGDSADDASEIETVGERAIEGDHKSLGAGDEVSERAAGREGDATADESHREAHVRLDKGDGWAEADRDAALEPEQETDSLGATAGNAGRAGQPEAQVHEELGGGGGLPASLLDPDQAGDASVGRDDEVLREPGSAKDERAVEDVEEVWSRASEADVEAADNEADSEPASEVTRPDHSLSKDEDLLREVFGTAPRGIDSVAEAEGPKGNGADRRSMGDEDDTVSEAEKPLTPDDGRLARVDVQGPSEAQSPSGESETVQDGEDKHLEAPAHDAGDAEPAAEQGTEGPDDDSHYEEAGRPDALDVGGDVASDTLEREKSAQADVDARRVESEAEGDRGGDSVTKPEPVSAAPKEREAEGPEPCLPLDKEEAVMDAMNGLADELGAEAVVLMQGPHVLASAGQMRAKEKKRLAEILAEGFKASDRVASLLGGEHGCREQIVDIGDFLIHSMAVDGDMVISTAVRSMVPLGAARLWVKRSAARVESLVGDREEE